MVTKDRINELRGLGLSWAEIGRKLGVSRQRIHQIVRGYRSPASLLSSLKPVEEIKRLTKRKREWLGMSDEDYAIKKGLIIPIENLRLLNSRKRRSLGVPSGKVNATGGRDHRRELVRMRDGHTCQICKRVWKNGERKFDVHHKDEDSSKTRRIDPVEEFDNLVTLCHSCHLGLHHGKVAL